LTLDKDDPASVTVNILIRWFQIILNPL
jgi:hypothetical protein